MKFHMRANLNMLSLSVWFLMSKQKLFFLFENAKIREQLSRFFAHVTDIECNSSFNQQLAKCRISLGLGGRKSKTLHFVNNTSLGIQAKPSYCKVKPVHRVLFKFH